MEIETERLLLRPWRPDDLEPLAAMSADPEVMEFFGPLDRDGTAALIARLEARSRADGYGMLAGVEKATGGFVGIIGLQRVPYEASFTPAIEVGWRLARAHWGKGFASEGAAACLDHGFRSGLEEIVAVAAVGNERSFAVMRRIGMVRDPHGEFDHPVLPETARHRRHALFRATPG